MSCLFTVGVLVAWATAGVAGARLLGRLTKLGFDPTDFWFGVVTGPFLLLEAGREWLGNRDRNRRKTL